MRINLKQFKKVRENSDSATLKNERGHEITLAKKALAPHLIDQLKTLPLHLAEGTQEEIGEPNQNLNDVQQVVLQEPGAGPTPSQPPAQSSDSIAAHVGFLAGKYGPEAIQNHLNAAFAPERAVVHGVKDFVKGFSQGQGNMQQQPQQAPMADQNGPMSVGPATPPQQQMPQQQMPDTYGQFMGGQNEYMKGVRGEAEAQGQLGQKTAAIEHEFGDSQKQNFMNYQNHLEEINSERENIVKDIRDNHIKPNQYLENMSTQGKVASAIGIILSGIGAGLTGKDNLALEFLNKQIDRDIASQRANLDQKNNLLYANFRREGNLQNAMTMTRINLQDIMSHKIAEEAAKSAYPNAQARAQQLIGMSKMNTAGQAQQLAFGRMMMNGMQSGQSNPDQQLQALRYLNPKMAEDMEKRYVPGVGVASVPISDKNRDEMQIRAELDQKLGKMEAFAKQHSGSVDPKVVNQGAALARDTQDTYRRANGQGVFREAEKDFVEKSINSDPTKFLSTFRTVPGYKAIREGNKSALKNLYRAHGINSPMGTFQEGAPVRPK